MTLRTREAQNGVSPGTRTETTVLVAVESAQVREALVAMLGALDGFRVVAEAATQEQALGYARSLHPQLALVDQELSGHGGWWTIQTLKGEQLAQSIVAIGRGGVGIYARLAGACDYVQIGTSPKDLLRTLNAAISAA